MAVMVVAARGPWIHGEVSRMGQDLGRLGRITLVLGLTVALATTAVAGKTGGKKHDRAVASMQNIRALVLDMQMQVGVLDRLTDDPSTYPGKAAAEPREKTYATERNGRLNDLRQKARLLETASNQLRQQLAGQASAEVLKISRALYQGSKSLQATIERFPREPKATVDNVLVSQLDSDMGTLDEQTRMIVVAFDKTP
jgi:hypothetical protein